MPIWPFQRSRERADAQTLLAQVSAASRNPAFYGPGRAPDTLEGRFELVTLFAALALRRLRAETGAAPLIQAFTDAVFSQFDAGLREAAIGDLSVPKRMHRLAGDFYGRLGAYSEAFGENQTAPLSAAIGRNVLGEETSAFAETLAMLVAALAAKQAAAPASALLFEAGWRLEGEG
jgi:cytochrome b pre-mRNA-processing protein 3